MIVLAHRGWWKTAEEKNTRAAFARAFEAGYGAELDVRDLDGDLVISHDPPRAGAWRFSELLDLYRVCNMPGRLAINIKADGLASRIAKMTQDLQASCFVFDMSVPDMLDYLDCGLPTFTRYSEYETVPALFDSCAGVWLDAFAKPWADETRLKTDLDAGKAVALVSPELHAKPHLEAWKAWRTVLRVMPESVRAGAMICTDRPDEAERFFTERGLS